MTDAWRIARPTHALYRRLAEHVGGGRSAAARHFRLGYGYIDTSTVPPTVQPPPSDLSLLPGMIMAGDNTPWTGSATGGWTDQTSLISCLIPRGTFPAPVLVSCVGLYTEDMVLIAASAFLPKWIGSDDEVEELITILFPGESS
jgi:hypothetical protein